MNEPMPLIHLGCCPICEGGLCRVRVCGVTSGKIHPIAICDECEAMWTEPNLSTPHHYADAEEPRSPINNDPIWEKSNRWATVEDVCLLGWYEFVYIERASI